MFEQLLFLLLNLIIRKLTNLEKIVIEIKMRSPQALVVQITYKNAPEKIQRINPKKQCNRSPTEDFEIGK